MALTTNISSQTIDSIGIDSGDANTGSDSTQTPTSVSTTASNAVVTVGETDVSSNAVPASILETWGELGDANLSKVLRDRIIHLASIQDVPVRRALQAISLKHFLAFWNAIPDDAAEPQITLAPDGALHAEWFKSPKQRLDIRFSEQRAIFGLFANNSILEGAQKFEDVAFILSNHPSKPLLWHP
ncbi:MAG TPA: hypothetical protein VHZ78_01660 [Rhizomicrobium sp.]|jgi:hypothetical protein|nr:hypothetical protein [Rhizomicrobium sp.]